MKDIKLIFAAIAVVFNLLAISLVLANKLTWESYLIIGSPFTAGIFGIYSWYIKNESEDKVKKLEKFINLMEQNAKSRSRISE